MRVGGLWSADVRAGGARGAVGRVWVERGGLGRGTLPRGSGRQRGGPSGEADPARLVGIAGRQRHLDPGFHLGDPGGHFDQGQTHRVGLGVALDRGLGRQAAQGVQ